MANLFESVAYLGVLPCGTEVAYDHKRVKGRTNDHEEICQNIVRKAGLSRPWNAPDERVTVRLYRLEIADAKIVRRPAATVNVCLPAAPMTSDELHVALEDETAGFPEEFRQFVRSQAHDRVHSASREEVLSAARDIAYDLRRAFTSYQLRTRQAIE